MKKIVLGLLLAGTMLSATNLDTYKYTCENRQLIMKTKLFDFVSATYNGLSFEGRGEKGNMIMFESSNGTRLGFVDNGEGDTYLIYMSGQVYTNVKCTRDADSA